MSLELNKWKKNSKEDYVFPLSFDLTSPSITYVTPPSSTSVFLQCGRLKLCLGGEADSNDIERAWPSLLVLVPSFKTNLSVSRVECRITTQLHCVPMCIRANCDGDYIKLSHQKADIRPYYIFVPLSAFACAWVRYAPRVLCVVICCSRSALVQNIAHATY